MRKGTDVKLYEKTLHKESKKQKARKNCENTPCFDAFQSSNYNHLIGWQFLLAVWALIDSLFFTLSQ